MKEALVITKLNFSIFICFALLSSSSLLAQNPCSNDFPANGNVRINTITPDKSLTVGGSISCPDVAIQLKYDFETSYYGILALTTPVNFEWYSELCLPLSNKGDVVLSAFKARDLILNTQDPTGSIRFGTTEQLAAPPDETNDIERMTITANGRIGIWNNAPKNLFTVREPIGFGFYQDLEAYQDLRFNCYFDANASNNLDKEDSLAYKESKSTESLLNTGYLNIQTGYSSIIQARNTAGFGSLLMAVSKSNQNEDENVEFFENVNYSPKGLLFINYPAFGELTTDYTNIGVAKLPAPTDRFTIRGYTSDNTMNALNIFNGENTSIFKVRNDGLVCTKEVIVQLSGTPCWPDYVFNDDYKLIPIEELEQKIKTEKKLPGLPNENEVIENGIMLGDMQRQLVQKIEELTLYVIQLKKENDELNRRLENLETIRK